MRLEHYKVETSGQAFTFEFDSEGSKGRIRKVIQFVPLAGESVFNLGFGDKSLKTGDFDDLSVTNNNDTEKVLATVVTVVYAFSGRFPRAWIYATGSTPARTRLYRMGITKYYHLAVKDFYIFGQRPDDEWEPFQKGRDYQAFLVTRKELRFGI